MSRLATLLLSWALVLSACDTPATIMTQNRPVNQPVSTLLTPEARSALQQQFDIGAMDELLATMSASEQQETLSRMGVLHSGTAQETREISVPMHSSDPVRQQLIERMWAPYWDHLPPEFLDRTDLPFPGREIARARRAARAASRQKDGGQ